MKIQSTQDIASHKVKLAIYGKSGAGKTMSVVGLVNAGYKPIVASFEGGLLSLQKYNIPYLDGTRDDNDNSVPKEDRADRLRDIFKFLRTDEMKQRYDTIVLDSLTEISQCLYDKLKKEYPDRKDSLVLFGELGQRTRDLVKAFRDLEYHVVFTVLSKIDKDDTGRHFAGFDLIGGIAEKLPQFLDIVTYLKVDNEKNRSFICAPTDAILAKDRSGKLNDVEYDLGTMFNKILNKEGENKNVRSK
jgi:hypothetical protein